MWTTLMVMIVGACLAPLSFGQDYRKGDEVIVRRDAPLKVDTETVGTVRRGDRLVVEDVRGKWLWVRSGQTRGWIESNSVTAAESVSLGIWVGGSLTAKNLAQIEQIAAVLRTGSARVVALQPAPITEKDLFRLEVIAERRSPNDRTQVIALQPAPPNQREALKEALESIRSKCPVYSGNVVVDAVVFIGFLNGEKVSAPRGAEEVPAHDRLDRLVGLALGDGLDVYVFDGDVPWRQKYTFDGRGLRDKEVAGKNMNVAMLARRYHRIAWYAGNPGGEDFGAFVRAVLTREPSPGQIRPLEAKP